MITITNNDIIKNEKEQQWEYQCPYCLHLQKHPMAIDSVAAKEMFSPKGFKDSCIYCNKEYLVKKNTPLDILARRFK